MSLFAARAPSFGVIAPTLTRSATGTTAYWQSGERVYALTGSAPRQRSSVLPPSSTQAFADPSNPFSED